MNSIDQKKKTIKEFVERDYYNEHVRNLIDECLQKDRNNITLTTSSKATIRLDPDNGSLASKRRSASASDETD